MEKCGKIEGKYIISFINKLLECLSEFYPQYRSYSIIPNKNGNFCKIDDLYRWQYT